MNANGIDPTFQTVRFAPYNVIPDDATPAVAGQNNIPNSARVVTVGAVTNDANDWITLPPIADVLLGHKITILCSAGTNFELRTPATSNTKINDVDSDGTQEYLCTDTDTVEITKISATQWIGQSITKLGAVRTAVVPD